MLAGQNKLERLSVASLFQLGQIFEGNTESGDKTPNERESTINRALDGSIYSGLCLRNFFC